MTKKDPGTDAALSALAALHCSPQAPKLRAAEVRAQLAGLAGWQHIADRIEKTFRFPDYYRTMAFVNAVVSIAHREDHHPDLGVHYDHCVVAWSTHSAGGVTQNDCICAAKAESFYA